MGDVPDRDRALPPAEDRAVAATPSSPSVSTLRASIPSAFEPLASRLPEGVTWSYKLSIRAGRMYHQWELVGPRGGIHVNAWWSPSEWSRENWIGGIEGHSPIAHEYSSTAPSHEHCWLIGGPCWHDGSSLQFSEQIAPWLPRAEGQMGPAEHADVLRVMLNRYDLWLPTAQAIEARRAETAQQAPSPDESAVPQGCAQSLPEERDSNV